MLEHEKAHLWRKAMGLSRRKLASLIGLSESNIADIEAGVYRINKRPVPEPIMRRYRMLCGAVTAGLAFDWYRAKLKTDERREIEFPVVKKQENNAP
jgi:transcriptional regulator with XRE-family HTH domain